jgi:GT2 family glycosyltransferase
VQAAHYKPNIKDQLTVIVILNWNGWRDTIECLDSVADLTHTYYAVIVVDNASTDESRQQILSHVTSQSFVFAGELIQSSPVTRLAHKHWYYLQSPINGGFAAGNNLGIRYALNAGAEYVWLLNNDTTVDHDALSALLQRMQKDTSIGMCGSLLCYYDDQTVVQAVGGVQYDFLRARGLQIGHGMSRFDPSVAGYALTSPTYIAGASLCLSAEFLNDVGLMEERYFLYFEELDWAVRSEYRWKNAIALNSLVYHKEGASIGTSSRTKRSTVSQYYLHRNLIIFYALRKKRWLYVAMWRVGKEMIKQLLRADWRMAKVTLLAMVDGLCMRHGYKVL